MGKIRKFSNMGIYHVYLRGISRYIIFYDDEDRLQFCYRLAKYSKEQNVSLFAYVLMDNHIHLLLRAQALSAFIWSVMISYVKSYNFKYKMSGNLCEKPFSSAPKDSIEKFNDCLSYILQNPVRAGMCKSIYDYRWSSANVYFNKKTYNSMLVPIDFSFAETMLVSREHFKKISENSITTEKDLREEKEIMHRCPYGELLRYFNLFLNGKTLSELSKNELKSLTLRMLNETCATYGQIASLLHVSYEFVRRVSRTPRISC